jgi:nucleotide-binding universal stress UspA family protein
MRTLAAIDLGPSSEATLREAVAHRPPNGRLAICHVLPSLTSIRPLFPHLAGRELTHLAELPVRAKDEVARRADEVTGLAESDREIFIEEGSAYAMIAQRAKSWKADRVVIGASGAGGLARLFGSTAERVVRFAPCEVLCVRDAARSGPVIAATDLSDPSIPAMASAAAEAAARGVALVAVHAVDFGDATLASMALTPFGTNLIPSDAVKSVTELAEQTIGAHLSRIGAKGEIVVRDGPAARIIVALAEERGASLVVVATRGRTGLAHLALGSVAERVVGTAPCSVLAVRHDAG